MTFNEIEKEFDELWGKSRTDGHYWDEPECTAIDLKSFLKQSFIKYLQSEVERLEKSKKENPGMHICFPLKEITFTSEIDGKEICVHKHQVETYNQAVSELITYYKAQIKEMEV